MRASGILMPISALPSKYGIGTLGKEAYAYADFLKNAKQKFWQVLPVSPTSYGDSPYQSFSTFAGNPYFIDFDMLKEDGLLKLSEYSKLYWGTNPEYIDYEWIYKNRFSVLQTAFKRFIAKPLSAEYISFKEEKAFWLDGYALYMAVKTENGGVSWLEWSDELKRRDYNEIEQAKKRLEDEIEFWKFVQYKFFEQWTKWKKYVNELGIKIIGDIPIYVAMDSADVWSNPKYFSLDEKLEPIDVAGCPPDYFSETGQLWGNPIYNWDVIKADGYDWWIKRIKAAMDFYDLIRIDHFRGFEAFYAIPAENDTAIDGEWRKGPGIELFRRADQEIGAHVPIIAEDLGIITDEVRALLAESGYPGMKVLEFAFTAGQESDYMPHNFNKNCICYAGTHDNNTLAGWIEEMSKEDYDYLLKYTRTKRGANEKTECIDNLIALAWESAADTVIIQMQDVLKQGGWARMNTPSTVGGNWQWRMKKGLTSAAAAKYLRELTETYFR